MRLYRKVRVFAKPYCTQAPPPLPRSPLSEGALSVDLSLGLGERSQSEARFSFKLLVLRERAEVPFL